MIMGNDNFTPELDPKLTVARSFLNPAWRDNRVLGIPSDSEQADGWRSIIFWLGSLVFPTWIVSQGYLFLTLIIGVFSMGKVTQILNGNSKSSQLFGSLLYLFSPITVWIYFYPVHLFVGAYAFTPLVLWTLLRVILHPTMRNKLLLLGSSLLMGTTALTATMFITASIAILGVSFFSSIYSKKHLANWLIGISIFILPQLFWILPFSTYVQSNSSALQDSYINREITTSTVESEQSNNTVWNTLRFSTAWMDTKENDIDYTYSSRDWFKSSPLGINLGFIPAILALAGIIFSLTKFKQNSDFLLISLIGFFGWVFLTGNNPPFNQIYSFFDSNIPLFHQVFRWGSSKFWPLLLIPMLILASKGLSSLLAIGKKSTWFQGIIFILFTGLIVYSTHPLITSKLVRDEIFVTVPDSYTLLSQSIPDQTSIVETTPHTNTRYFRRHDWGFWGSVFLNYLLPNPTTEKALIIGSSENEIAYNLLDEAYYSDSPSLYSNALSRYHIPYILSDQSVSNTGLGNSYSFPYDWDIHDRMVIRNPAFNQIWAQDFLELYQNELPVLPNTFTIANGHNYSMLNKSLALLNINDNYVASQESGDIYPLSLSSTNTSIQDSFLSLSSQLTSSGNYSVHLSKDELSTLPLIAKIIDSELYLSPYYPSLFLNDSPVYTLPQSITSLPSGNLTIGDKLITTQPTLIDSSQLTKSATWSNETSRDLTSKTTSTPCNSSGNIPSNQLCFSADTNVEKASIVNITTTLTSTTPTMIDICLHSYLDNSCLNSPQTHLVSNQSTTITFPSNQIVKPNDNLVIFYVVKAVDDVVPNTTISNLIVNLTDSSKALIVNQPLYQDIDATINLNHGDTLTRSLPITQLIPSFQVFRSTCPERGPLNNIDQTGNQLTLTTSNCFDGLYSSFSLPQDLQSVGLLSYANAKYTQGIPLEYNLKQSGVERKIATDLLPTRTQDFLKFTILPVTNQNFTLELTNKGIGKNPSINTLIDFATIPVPSSWLSLKLVNNSTPPPPNISTLSPFIPKYSTGTYLSQINGQSDLYTLPTATSPYWRATVIPARPQNILELYYQVLSRPPLTDKSLANGWQDTWTVTSQDQDKYLAVIYYPNVLAYLGLFIGIGIAFGLVVARQATKTSSTHTTG